MDENIKKYFVGIKENKFGFEGLVKDKKQIKKLLKDTVIVEKPTLEDVMLYFTKEEFKCSV